MPIYIACPIKQNAVLNVLAKNNIQSRRYFTPSLDTAYPQLKSDGCNNSHELAGGVICLPLHNFMTKTDVAKIISVIKDTL